MAERGHGTFLVISLLVTLAAQRITAEPAACRPSEWPCSLVTGECIAVERVCDSNIDCANRADESANCSRSLCDSLSCQHACHSSPTGGVCICQKGFRVNPADNRTCQEYNECTDWGRCDQRCTRVQSSRDTQTVNCSCNTGYRLHSNGHTCLLDTNVVPTVAVLYLRGDKLRRLNGSEQDVVVSTNTISIDVDVQRQRLYWIDRQAQIFESSLDGNNASRKQISTVGLLEPIALAVDWIGQNLYVVDKLGHRIDLISLHNYKQNNILSYIVSPTDIALDPSRGLLFYLDEGDRSTDSYLYTGGIAVAGMDGSQHRFIYRSTDLLKPTHLTLDRVNQYVYISDRLQNAIFQIDYTGGARRYIVRSPSPESLAVFEDSIYFTDSTRMAICRANVYNRTLGVQQLSVDRTSKPVEVLVVHPNLQQTAFNVCANATCEHTCVLSPADNVMGLGYRCMCMTGYQSNARDPTRCEKIKSFLLFASQHAIRAISLSSHNDEIVRPEAIKPIVGLDTNFVAVDYDMAEDQIYYSDVRKSAIFRVRSDGSDPLLIASVGVRGVEGMSLDWSSKNLYFTDNSGYIGVVQVRNPRNLIFRRLISNLGNPRAIAASPIFGLIFWTEWLRNRQQSARIGRAVTDGSNVVYIRTQQLGWPNGLTIDLRTRRIWWCDAMFDRIQSSLLDGNDTKTLGSVGMRISHPFGLAISEDNLYYTDIRIGGIVHTILNNPQNQDIIWRDYSKLYEVKVFDTSKQASNVSINLPCTGRNIDCSHFCFPVFLNGRAWRHCGCPQGYKINATTQNTCIENPDETKVNCPLGSFMCDNGHCVSASYRCDGDNDCFDNSDERNCSALPVSCTAEQFQCANHRCIPRGWICDGDNDCRDMSDEQNCPRRSCSPTEYRCLNDRCVDERLLCDADNDCEDGSDELPSLCDTRTCAIDQFHCSNGKCTPLKYTCDGDNDCGDMSDEHNCEPANCSSEEFHCHSSPGPCIPSRYRCDKQHDCADGSDEVDCRTHTSSWRMSQL